MMPSFVGAGLSGLPAVPLQYTHDALLEDLSRQISMSASRRHSRGSNSALSGNAMRVAKPSSASNSPRNNMSQRRRTLMNDPIFVQRTQQMLEQPCLPTPGPEAFANTYYEPVKRSARPVSWHPSTQLVQNQPMPSAATQHTQYPFPTCYDYESYVQPVQLPPTPAAYSTYNSPLANFSPLTLPYSAYELPQQGYTSPVWNLFNTQTVSAMTGSTDQTQAMAFDTSSAYTPATVPDYVESSYSPASWANAPAASYTHNMTAPPTPEDLPKAQQVEPLVVKEESEAQQEDEEEGDILIGLGLYDPPEKLPCSEDGGVLSAAFEPKGKGLKLEDAWEPPASDDEDEEDGEGEAENDDD